MDQGIVRQRADSKLRDIVDDARSTTPLPAREAITRDAGGPTTVGDLDHRRVRAPTRLSDRRAVARAAGAPGRSQSRLAPDVP